MNIDKTTSLGGINISLEAIASVAGDSATSCFGVVGLSARNSLIDDVNFLLGRENFSKGINVEKHKKDYSVNVYLILAPDVKVSEIAIEAQKKIKYDLEKTFGIKFKAVNIFIQGINQGK